MYQEKGPDFIKKLPKVFWEKKNCVNGQITNFFENCFIILPACLLMQMDRKLITFSLFL